MGHLQNTRQLASTFIHYHKEVSTMPTRLIQVLEEHILHVGILLQLIYHVTPKAVSFERGLEQEKALQQVQTVVEAALSFGSYTPTDLSDHASGTAYYELGSVGHKSQSWVHPDWGPDDMNSQDTPHAHITHNGMPAPMAQLIPGRRLRWGGRCIQPVEGRG